MTEIATFWNDKHTLAKKANELFEQLVPGSGKCDSVVGELLRASTRIGYDWFNNGWGCNNWSGAVQFIREYQDHLPLGLEVALKLDLELDFVYEFSHGEPAPHNQDRATAAVTTIHEIIVQGILDTSPVDWANNTVDMYELSEEDYIPEEEEEDEYNEEDDDEYN